MNRDQYECKLKRYLALQRQGRVYSRGEPTTLTVGSGMPAAAGHPAASRAQPPDSATGRGERP
jgi:hypothetical protein